MSKTNEQGLVLAIDLGSTSFKATVFDPDGQRRGAGSQALRYHYGPGGVVELDTNVVVEAFGQSIRDALRVAGARPDALAAIAVTSQAQTFTVVGLDGRPKMPFVSWQDGRATAACEALSLPGGLTNLAQHSSFACCLPALHVAQLRHLQDTQPGFIQDNDRILHLPTFFVSQCTGTAVMDTNLAGMSGLYSLIEGGWWSDALRACQLTTGQLASLVPVGAIAATTTRDAERYGLPPNVPVVLAGNDQTAGAYGARLDENGALLITLGTAQVIYSCEDSLAEPTPGLIRGPYPNDRYYRMAADSAGCSVINWAKTVIQGCETDARLNELAEQAEPGCRGLEFDGALLNSPGGVWRNLGLHHQPADLARSVFEGLTRRLTAAISAAGIEVADRDLLIAGGGAASRTWVDMLAHSLNASATVIDADPLVGAARMGLDAVAGSRGTN